MTLDSSASPVSTEETVGGVRIALILMGVVITLPAFAMGAQLAHSLGTRHAITASWCGGLLLAAVASLAAVAGARSRLSSYMLIVQAFGTRGGALANAVLAISMFGWFAVIAMLFGRAMQPSAAALLPHIPVTAWALIGCALMTATAAVGFRALDLLSLVTTPLKLGLLFATFWFALHMPHAANALDFAGADSLSVGSGISFVVGGLIVGAVLAPDVCRFARTPLQGALGVCIAYGVGFPLVLNLSGIPSIVTGAADLVEIMKLLGMGLPCLLIILLSAWVTNAYNLYAASLVLVTVAPKRPRWGLALAAGVIGTLLGVLGVGDKMVPFLIVLSVAVPPIAGVYLANFYLGAGKLTEATPGWRVEALGAWGLATGIAAWMQAQQMSVTTIPALDSLLLSIVAYAVLRRLVARRLPVNTQSQS